MRRRRRQGEMNLSLHSDEMGEVFLVCQVHKQENIQSTVFLKHILQDQTGELAAPNVFRETTARMKKNGKCKYKVKTRKKLAGLCSSPLTRLQLAESGVFGMAENLILKRL